MYTAIQTNTVIAAVALINCSCTVLYQALNKQQSQSTNLMALSQ